MRLRKFFFSKYVLLFLRYDLGDKVEENDKRTYLEKEIFLKRIRIRQETDLKIPKALSNRVFNNGYSKHFRDMASGDKVEENDERTCLEKKNFSQTYSNKAGNGFGKFQRALSNRVFDNGYSKHFRDMTSGTKLKKMIIEQC